jgi:hypothetical protein
MLNKLVVLLAVFCSSCSIKPLKENCDPNTKLWLQRPIYVKLHSSLEDKQLFIDGINYWNEISVDKDLIVVVDDNFSGGNPNDDDKLNVIYGVGQRDFNKEFKEGTIAVTIVYYTGLIISEGDIFVIDKSNLNLPIVIHELGHLLGLKHNEDDYRSIMYPYTVPNQRLTDRDVNSAMCMNYYIKP